MKCPSCNLFASLEMGDVVIDSLEVDAVEQGGLWTYTVSSPVTIVRNSACCGEEMKEATFYLEAVVEVDKDALPTDADPDDCEAEETSTDTIEEDGFYGATITGVVHVGNGPNCEVGTWTWSDKISASSMDELC